MESSGLPNSPSCHTRKLHRGIRGSFDFPPIHDLEDTVAYLIPQIFLTHTTNGGSLPDCQQSLGGKIKGVYRSAHLIIPPLMVMR